LTLIRRNERTRKAKEREGLRGRGPKVSNAADKKGVYLKKERRWGEKMIDAKERGRGQKKGEIWCGRAWLRNRAAGEKNF